MLKEGGELKNRLSKPELVFLIFSGILSVVLVLLATSRFGLGLSTDGVYYLSAADHVAAGQGVIDFKGFLLVTWPPLLPILAGAISAMFGVSTLLAGELINLVSLFLTVFCAGLLIKAGSLERKSYFYLGVLACAMFVSFVALASNMGSDSLFILLSLLFLLLLQTYYQKPTSPRFAALVGVAATAALLRWTGIAFIAIGGIFLLILDRGKWKKAFRQAALFGGSSALPFLLWVVGRNYRLTHTFIGSRNIGEINVVQNLQIAWTRMWAWVLPNTLTKRIDPLLLLLALLVVLFLVNKRKDWQAWSKQLLRTSNLPLVIFVVVYFVFVLFTSFTIDHQDVYDDRYQAPIFLPLLILIFVALDSLVFPNLKKFRKWGEAGLIAVFVVWLAYQGFLTFRFVKTSMLGGVAYYNLYNTADYRRSGFIQYLQSYEFSEGAPLYSNNAALVYFYAGRQVDNSIYDPNNFLATMDYLENLGSTWPPRPAYLIWFLPNQKRNYYSPEQLELISTLELIFAEGDGQLYLISPRD